MTKSLGYSGEGLFSDALKMFQRKYKIVLCDDVNLTHSFRHSEVSQMT